MAQPKTKQNEKQTQQNTQEWETTSLDSGFPRSSMVKIPPAMQETQEMWVQPLGWGDLLEEEMTTHSSILARVLITPWTEEPGGATVRGVTKSQKWLSNWARTNMGQYKQLYANTFSNLGETNKLFGIKKLGIQGNNS